jgi:hypothetical protein
MPVEPDLLCTVTRFRFRTTGEEVGPFFRRAFGGVERIIADLRHAL